MNILYTKIEGYHISTAYLKCSNEELGNFYETIVWEYNSENKARSMSEMMEAVDTKGEAIEQHYKAIVKYIR